MLIRDLPGVREFFQPLIAVLASAAFDPLHYGHIRYVRAAAEQARAENLPLVVAVAPDDYVKRRHPLVQPLEGRMEMLDALRWVDFDVHQGSACLARPIRVLRPVYLAMRTH